MASSGSLFKDDEEEAITDINVTPFVDVVLVLLVGFMVTAKLIIARGIDIDKPKAVTGAPGTSSLRVDVDRTGLVHVNGLPFPNDAAAIARIKEVAATLPSPAKAIVGGDREGKYGNVMKAIDLVGQAGDIGIMLENERP